MIQKKDQEIIDHAKVVFIRDANGDTYPIARNEVLKLISCGWNWDRLSNAGGGQFYVYLTQWH